MAHGQPSDPEPAETALAALARAVAGHLPGWRVLAATLAAPGRLEAREAALAGGAVLFPLFMAEGWFVRRVLPQRLRRQAELIRTPPLGLLPGLPALAARFLARHGGKDGRPPAGVVLAAHGSARGTAAAEAADAFAARLREALPAGTSLRTGFLEQAPFLADAARGMAEGAVCLPFFALAGEHVRHDIPEALARAGFGGPILPVLGQADGIAALIARTIRHAAGEDAEGEDAA